MKRAVIGGFLSLNGTVWCFAAALYCVLNLATEWHTPPGRFLATAIQNGMIIPLVIGAILFITGLCIMCIEYSAKEQ